MYGIDLWQVGNRLPWCRFEVLVGGLLACDSRLARHFQRQTTDHQEVSDDER